MSTSYETASYVGGLDNTIPTDSGAQGKRTNGAAEIRKFKDVVIDSFAAITGAVTSTHSDLNLLTGHAAAGRVVAAFAPGTPQLFYQLAAPTGWSITAGAWDHALRIVGGGSGGGTSAGAYNFSATFAFLAYGASAPGIGGHGLTSAQNGPHTHPQGATSGGSTTSSGSGATIFVPSNTGSSGSGALHYHSIDLRVKYANCIMADPD